MLVNHAAKVPRLVINYRRAVGRLLIINNYAIRYRDAILKISLRN